MNRGRPAKDTEIREDPKADRARRQTIGIATGRLLESSCMQPTVPFCTDVTATGARLTRMTAALSSIHKTSPAHRPGRFAAEVAEWGGPEGQEL